MKQATRDEWINEVMKMTKTNMAEFAHSLLEDKLLAEAENAGLREALRIADDVYAQLGYLMEYDECANDPHSSWPDTDCDGCAYCSASQDMYDYKKATEAAVALRNVGSNQDCAELPY